MFLCVLVVKTRIKVQKAVNSTFLLLRKDGPEEMSHDSQERDGSAHSCLQFCVTNNFLPKTSQLRSGGSVNFPLQEFFLAFHNRSMCRGACACMQTATQRRAMEASCFPPARHSRRCGQICILVGGAGGRVIRGRGPGLPLPLKDTKTS